MESNIKSSFIPKDTVQIGVSRPNYSRSGLSDIGVLLGIVLLVASAGLGIGTFLYEQYLNSSLASKREQLERAQAAFEPTLIAELTRLDDRMKSGELLLQRHAAPSILFALLEQLTLENVSFTDFELDAAQDDAYTITMHGIAQSVNSIALQADLFGKHTAIVSPIFSNIGREEDGVHFDVTANINPAAIRYTNLVASVSTSAQQQDASGALPQPSPDESQVPIFAP